MKKGMKNANGMKKMAGMASALVLAMSFGMTAFAANEAVDDSSAGLNNGQASTDVKLVYSDDLSQISATVPLSITVAVQMDGEFVCPKGYKIINNSVVPIHVSGMQIAEVANGYKLVDGDRVDGKQIRLTMKTAGDSVKLTGNDSGPAVQSLKAGGWDILTGDNNTLPITFENGKVGTIDSAWANGAAKLFTIRYTFEAGTAASN